MADKAVQSATTAMAEVRLDENGQPLSKNALKKLLKAEAAAKKKAEKAAAKVRYDLLSCVSNPSFAIAVSDIPSL